ncbi:ataxin-2 C-terminal region-containing protein [Nitzschia inconspicua]|uniref:Ataxin-2 C-terminal region-containing protein n=1 Tax=Nitzschia inconspicua TaxID=303405 RepID=A0A9K3KXQ9_9STRA|nr:ataxin-2 C-terminal region-containing protein [Nitzschia inconspicua]
MNSSVSTQVNLHPRCRIAQQHIIVPPKLSSNFNIGNLPSMVSMKNVRSKFLSAKPSNSPESPKKSIPLNPNAKEFTPKCTPMRSPPTLNPRAESTIVLQNIQLDTNAEAPVLTPTTSTSPFNAHDTVQMFSAPTAVSLQQSALQDKFSGICPPSPLAAWWQPYNVQGAMSAPISPASTSYQPSIFYPYGQSFNGQFYNVGPGSEFHFIPNTPMDPLFYAPVMPLHEIDPTFSPHLPYKPVSRPVAQVKQPTIQRKRHLPEPVSCDDCVSCNGGTAKKTEKFLRDTLRIGKWNSPCTTYYEGNHDGMGKDIKKAF